MIPVSEVGFIAKAHGAPVLGAVSAADAVHRVQPVGCPSTYGRTS